MRAHTHTRQKEAKLASSEGRHGTDALSLSLSLSDVLFRLLYAHTHTYVRAHTHEREREREEKEEKQRNGEAKQFDVCVCVCAHVALAIQTRRCVCSVLLSLFCFFFARPRKQTSVIRYAYKRSSFGSRSTTMKRFLSRALSLPTRDETKSDNEEATADRLVLRMHVLSLLFENGARAMIDGHSRSRTNCIIVHTWHCLMIVNLRMKEMMMVRS